VIYYEGQDILIFNYQKPCLTALFKNLVVLLIRMSVRRLPNIFFIASVKVTGFRDVTSCSLVANYEVS
jgi:hypothetical protein